MKRILLSHFLYSIFLSQFIFISLSSQNCIAQADMWTWMHGDTIPNAIGVFGTQGVFSAANKPPGLYEPCEWTDDDYHFWLFGGQSNDWYNSLWEYDPSINQWRWQKGSSNPGAVGSYGTKGASSPTNTPGGRYAVTSWVDQDNNLWLYGGYGYDQSTLRGLNDLWKYNIATNEWTWMHGNMMGDQVPVYGTMGIPDPLNNPGGRLEAVASWTDDAGNLWLFGGQLCCAPTQGYIDDLWKYDVSTNEWTWMKGPSIVNQAPVYGTQGIADPVNQPGARRIYSHWKDEAGAFWIFGGQIYGGGGCYNDIWKIHPDTLEWAWMNGDNSANGSASVGTQCSLSVTNAPDSRMENRFYWTDPCYKFYTFGGYDTYDGNIYNDLWLYDPDINEWSWISGSTAPYQTNHYGTQGIADPANHPSYRYGGVPFTDSLGNLWLFGGVGPGKLNDLWKFVPDSSCNGCIFSLPSFTAFASSDTVVCEKFCIDFYDSSANAVSWEWFFLGAAPSSSTDQNPSGICYDNPGTFDVTLITTNSSGLTDTLTLFDYITVFTNPFAPVITQSGNILTSSPADSYQWYLNTVIVPGATNQSFTVTTSGLYTVVIADSNGCVAQSSIDVTAVSIEELNSDDMFNIYPNPSEGTITLELANHALAGALKISVMNTIGQKVFSLDQDISSSTWKGEIDLTYHPNGLYFIEIIVNDFMVRKKIIIAR